MKPVILMLVALTLLLGGVDQVKAGALPTHALVGVQTLDGGVLNLPGETVSLEGNGALDTGLLSDSSNSNGLYAGSAQASTTPVASSLLHAYSQAVETGGGAFSPRGMASAGAAWRDVAFINSTSPPAVLQFNIVVDGTFATTGSTVVGTSQTTLAFINITTTNNPTTFFQGFDDVGAGIATGYANPQAELSPDGFSTASGFWDSATFDGTNFEGTFHIDVPYDPSLGGYGWGVQLVAGSVALDGSATTNFLDTAGLQSVTLPDGTPVSGLTFDSGLVLSSNASAAPEPASLTLFGLGAVCALGYSWQRRKRGEAEQCPPVAHGSSS